MQRQGAVSTTLHVTDWAPPNQYRAEEGDEEEEDEEGEDD